MPDSETNRGRSVLRLGALEDVNGRVQVPRGLEVGRPCRRLIPRDGYRQPVPFNLVNPRSHRLAVWPASPLIEVDGPWFRDGIPGVPELASLFPRDTGAQMPDVLPVRGKLPS